MLLVEHQGVIFSLILALTASCIIATVITLLVARYLVLITLVDVHILVPAVIATSLVGVYALKETFGDVILAAVFGIIGYLMIRLKFPRVTLVIALILGGIAERTLHQSLNMASDDWTIFFTRGISLFLILANSRVFSDSGYSVAAAAAKAEAELKDMTGLVQWRNFSISIGIAIFGAIYIVWARSYPRDLGTLPGLVGWLTVILGLLDALSYTNTTAGAKVRKLVGHTEQEDGTKAIAAVWSTSVASIAWPVAYVAAVAFFGFLATTPIYIVSYMWLFGKRSLRSSIISSLIVTALLVFTFEYLFQYPLFSGLLFGGTL